MTSPPPSGATPESLFAAWIGRVQAGEQADFGAFCRQHPQHSQALSELEAAWKRLEPVLRAHKLGGTFAERLKTQFGSGIDPQVTLEREEAGRSDFSSEVLSRLAGRGPSSLRYRIKGEVAHGGMGAVLRVWDEDLRRSLAMKVMLGRPYADGRTDSSAGGARTLARFIEEAQITGQLDHPGIVPVHELGLDPQGRVYFTMKLVKGQTLKQVFDELTRGEGGWTQTRVLGLILKVCEAMSYAHAKGVIHRDLKPANIMVGRFGEVFVMDWGLAKVLGRGGEKDIRLRPQPALATSKVHSGRHDQAGGTPDSPLFTMEGDVVGTPAYMSPEQARGDLAAMGPHSDVYAVGAMLYHLLADHMPYVGPGVRADNYAVWRWVQQGPPEALHKEAPSAPAELVALCDKAMAREPGQRYADMSALAADLSAYIEGRVVHAYETGAWAEARKWVLRNKPLAVAMATAVLLLVVGLISSLLLRARSDRNAERAEASERVAREETAKVLRLSDAKVLQELEQAADAVWPAYPEEIAGMEAWLARARALLANLPSHRQTLGQMRARALSWTEQQREQDRRTHPLAEELVRKRSELEGLIARLDQGLQGESGADADRRVAELEPQVVQLTAEVESRRSWRLQTPEEQWQHDVLAELIAGLERLEAGLLADDVVTADHSWSMPRRLAFARRLENRFAAGGEYARAWADALPAIRARYPGLELGPQMGLLPIGPDPDSGLWEFAHLMSGAPAERGADGRLVLREATAVVLVLLPGGSFWMGAQSSDPGGRNYDPRAQADESPVHEVELSPFFLSKYEMTQGQWERLTGYDPSFERKTGSAPTLLHPVEQVRWVDCMAWLHRAGLTLPSEAQWEYGARGGTDTPWWTGREQESLRTKNAANLADRAADRGGATWPAIKEWPELDDGYMLHAPIGTYAANAFGLYEVAGNLWEWCLDGYEFGFYLQSRGRDPVAPWQYAATRPTRGGGFTGTAEDARVAVRPEFSPDRSASTLGVRPAARVVSE